MIVSDASPINYLVLVGAAYVLPELYGQVVLPEEVRHELRHPKGPEVVRSWIESAPPWLSVQDAPSPDESTVSGSEVRPLQRLDAGERAAILLAEKSQADFLLIDERAGRRVARAYGVPVTGTIGVLGAAVTKGYVKAAEVVIALRETSFRASPDLYRWLLDKS